MKIFDLTVTFKCEVVNSFGIVSEAKVFKRKRRAIRWAMSRVSNTKRAVISIYLDNLPEKKKIRVEFNDVIALMRNSGFEGAVEYYNAIVVKMLGV